MNRKALLKQMGRHLEEIRQSLRFNSREMGDNLGISKSAYRRNETGETSMDIWSLFILAANYNISLDWMICRRGERYYKKSTAVEPAGDDKKTEKLAKTVFTGELGKELRDLIEQMEQVPRLRYEVLALFHKFKEERAK